MIGEEQRKLGSWMLTKYERVDSMCLLNGQSKKVKILLIFEHYTQVLYSLSLCKWKRIGIKVRSSKGGDIQRFVLL